ncbi:hypothetical protein AX17_007120 [Amanita inopinata Kibby_2008]|nr:hypothetical protein AX17_007120 [Amanita inopinata Kibby_2008]
MSSALTVYKKASEIPSWVISALQHDRNANVIIPQIEKSKKDGRDRGQLWVVCAPNRKVKYVLAVTEGPIGAYPAFIFTTEGTTESPRQLKDEMTALAAKLKEHSDARRVYSVFAPEATCIEFCDAWTSLTGISQIEKPYYDALISYCTPKTFVKDDTKSRRIDHDFELRLANEGDIEMVAELCQGFSEESWPFILESDGALEEVEYLVENQLVWVYMIRMPGTGQREIASIVACTRNYGDIATITKVYTSKKWRKNGCAGRLVNHVCKE